MDPVAVLVIGAVAASVGMACVAVAVVRTTRCDGVGCAHDRPRGARVVSRLAGDRRQARYVNNVPTQYS